VGERSAGISKSSNVRGTHRHTHTKTRVGTSARHRARVQGPRLRSSQGKSTRATQEP
jgi:hypothetical protein